MNEYERLRRKHRNAVWLNRIVMVLAAVALALYVAAETGLV